jgi:LCP family protein required for cell wall assembly
MLSCYSALVVATQLDDTFFPGNEFGIGPFARVPGVDSPVNPDFAGPEERINVLVLGLDLRRDEPDDLPARTDTIMITSIDPYAKTAGMLSIPRDTWVEIPDGNGGFYRNKINTAYEFGDLYDYPGGGPALIKDTLKHNFDIEVDNYIVLNFNNFISLIDELGGIDVNVPEYAADFAYNDCNACPYYAVEFYPGPQHMDGETALAYVRIRKSDNDFKRIERQQLVVRATAKKAASLGTILDNPVGLYREYKSAIKTDISEFFAVGRAKLLQQVDFDAAPSVSLADALYVCPAATCGEAAAYLWYPEEVEELKNIVFNPQANDPLINERAVVSVKNGTLTPDLAGEFASFLTGQGLESTQIAVDEYYDGLLEDLTVIYDLSGNKELTVQRLANWLKLPEARIRSANHPEAGQFIDEATTTDVVVVLGADANVPGTAASNANSSQIVTAGG